MSILLAACAAALAGLGAYLVLQRMLSRIIVGISLLSHAASILWLTAGRRGRSPIVDRDGGPMSDPFPQALALTAIVITFGLTAFLLALAYRSWELTDDDEVEHDVADVALRRRPFRRRDDGVGDVPDDMADGRPGDLAGGERGATGEQR